MYTCQSKIKTTMYYEKRKNVKQQSEAYILIKHFPVDKSFTKRGKGGE